MHYEAWVLVSLQGGCEMAMAVRALGPDGDSVDAVAKKASTICIWGQCRRICFFVYLCIFIADIGRNGSDEDKHGERGNCNSIHSFQGDHKSFQAAVS